MRSVFWLAVGVVAACAASPVLAHHSFASEFDINKPVTLKGTLTKIEWVNPHGWLHVDVKQPDGKVESWAVETGSSTSLLRAGMRKTDFAIGVDLVVEGFRARNGSHTAAGRSVKTPDGKNYFISSQPVTGAQ